MTQSPDDVGPRPRRQRADGLRNRERLLEAARAAFTEAGAEVGLEEIARRTGVGIATLYRHFPTREALVEAVYRRAVRQLVDSADDLLRTFSPGEALRQWMGVFVEYIATKRVMAPALAALAGGVPGVFAASGVNLIDTVGRLVSLARDAGEIRPDIEATDVLRALLGFTWGNTEPSWQASARRLVDTFMDGLRRDSAAEKTGP